jgi:hypothetical protein
MLSTAASAADVTFELGANLFKKPAGVEKNFAIYSDDSPLYDRLWPMTRETFQRLDFPVDREVFTFNIASNR